ncbi:MAG: preprotein translocase subunit SecE [Thermodesulfobacteriota bacterium]|nr:preprotein translocase subunit SecE [Thermodesulfobacteriota bacterium]
MANKKPERTGKKKRAVPDQPAGNSIGSQLERVKQFSAEVKTEFGKISWPARKQTLGSTVVVVILVMLISIYLGAVDLFLGKMISLILN